MADDAGLIPRARNLANQRGHKVGEFLAAPIEAENTLSASKGCLVGRCEYCGAAAVVDASPPPGGQEMFGDALEKDCPGEVFI